MIVGTPHIVSRRSTMSTRSGEDRPSSHASQSSRSDRSDVVRSRTERRCAQFEEQATDLRRQVRRTSLIRLRCKVQLLCYAEVFGAESLSSLVRACDGARSHRTIIFPALHCDGSLSQFPLNPAAILTLCEPLDCDQQGRHLEALRKLEEVLRSFHKP
jgi:hypothetical protein